MPPSQVDVCQRLVTESLALPQVCLLSEHQRKSYKCETMIVRPGYLVTGSHEIHLIYQLQNREDVLIECTCMHSIHYCSILMLGKPLAYITKRWLSLEQHDRTNLPVSPPQSEMNH